MGQFIVMKILSGSSDDIVDDFRAGRRIALQDQMASGYFMDMEVVEHFFETFQTGFRDKPVGVCLNVVRGKIAALKAAVQPRNFLQSGCKDLGGYLSETVRDQSGQILIRILAQQVSLDDKIRDRG